MSLDFSIIEVRPVEVFELNITHNLVDMANACGLYKYLWRPEENGIEYAKDLIPILVNGLDSLKSDPEHYIKYNASNGWGTYEQFVRFVEGVLSGCREFPEGKIEVSR